MSTSRKKRLKKIDKINSWTKKYQSLIQCISILFVLVTLFITVYQTSLTRKEVNVALQQNELNKQTAWDIIIDYPQNDVLKEGLIFKSKNPNIAIQKITLFIVEKIDLQSYDTYKSCFKINPTKKILEQVYTDCYTFKYDLFYYNIPLRKTSYPIAILYQYELFGKIKYECVLYELHYEIYPVGDKKIKIKTLGIEYKTKLEDSEQDYLKRMLINYNIEHCFLSELKNRDINLYLKEDLIKKDSVLKNIYNYVEINLRINHIVMTYYSEGDSSKSLYTVHKYLPLFYTDRALLNNRNTVVKKINILPRVNDSISLMLDSINIIQNKFIVLDTVVPKNREIILNEKEIEDWKRVNLNLESILFKQIKI